MSEAAKATAAPPRVVIYTDGGCQGNPGPGGWAAVLRHGERVKEVSGGEPATTNNRMELTAAVMSLRMLKKRCQVEIHTDSEYVKNGITQWIAGWKRKGWRTKAGTPVKNEDLWRDLDEQVARHDVSWKWVKGHAGVDGNERCDALCGTEMDRIRRSHTRDELAALLRAFKAQGG